MNWFLTVVIKAVLEWLMSLLVRLRELEQKKQEGRQEVIDAVNKKEEEVEKALQELGKASANTTDDDFARSMRDGYNADRDKDGVLGRRLPSSVNNSSSAGSTRS